jgi:hypothetical protein
MKRRGEFKNEGIKKGDAKKPKNLGKTMGNNQVTDDKKLYVVLGELTLPFYLRLPYNLFA